jgi:hypothetical protein
MDADSAHPLPPLIAAATDLDNYCENFVGTQILGHVQNGRIHAEINPHRSEDGGTCSFRFSYSHPPLQQMPKHDAELAPLIRAIFLPEENETWASCDISQQEFRLITHYAARHKLPRAQEAVERYRNDPNTDFHLLVSEWTGIEGQPAKNSNFARSYGAGLKKFAVMIGKSEAEAREIWDKYDRELPFVAKLSEACEQAVWRQGYLTLYGGARRHWNRWAPGGTWEKGAGPVDREEAERRIRDPAHPWFGKHLYADVRKAMNALIQGSAAYHTKLWMRASYRAGIVPLLQMHDSLELSVRTPAQSETVAQLGCSVVADLKVPMKVDVKFGRTWGDAKHTWAELPAVTPTVELPAAPPPIAALTNPPRLAMPLPPEAVERLVAFAIEREAIRLRKEAGQSLPWTDDPILASGHFCNVHRENDRGTRWITEHWRDPHCDDPDLWFAMVQRVASMSPLLSPSSAIPSRSTPRIFATCSTRAKRVAKKSIGRLPTSRPCPTRRA